MNNITPDELSLIIQKISEYGQELERDIKTAIEDNYPNYKEYRNDRDEYDSVCYLLDKLRGE